MTNLYDYDEICTMIDEAETDADLDRLDKVIKTSAGAGWIDDEMIYKSTLYAEAVRRVYYNELPAMIDNLHCF